MILIKDDSMLSLSGIILLLLHQGYSRISVSTVQLGEPASFTCVLPSFEYSNARIKWYKQSVDDTLVLITTLMKGTANPTFEKGFASSRFHVNYTGTTCTLTVLKTIPEDEAVYHCAIMTWSEDSWSATFLSLKGNIRSTSKFTVIQWPTASHTVHSEDSVSLQCSLFTDSQRTACPSDHSVYLSGVKSDRSHGTIVSNEANKQDECDRKPDERPTPKSCVYHFSKDVSSSDTESYLCAVATCGEILSGNKTGLDIKAPGSSPFVSHEVSILMHVLCGVLITVLMALFIYCIKKSRFDPCAAVTEAENVAEKISKRGEVSGIYSAVIFTMVKTSTHGPRDGGSADRERIYAAVKAFDWDQHIKSTA